jgi:STE24 endopeptidase
VLLVAAVGGLARWAAGPILFIGMGGGAVTLTRGGERVAIRAAFGFRRPSPAQAAVLQPL